MGQQPLEGQSLHINKASRSHSGTPQSIGILWTSDQPSAETSTYHHTTHKTDTTMIPAGFEHTIPGNERPLRCCIKLQGNWDRRAYRIHTSKQSPSCYSPSHVETITTEVYRQRHWIWGSDWIERSVVLIPVLIKIPSLGWPLRRVNC